MRALWIVRTVSEFDEAVTGADLEGLVEGITGDDGWSQLFLSHACSTVFGLWARMVHLKMLLAVWSQKRSGQDALTSGLFPGSRVLLVFVGDPVYRECIADWQVFEGRWISVSAAGTLTGASDAQLASCDGITGDTRYPCHVGELEKIEDLINASDLLKWNEQSREVADSIRVNEELVCRQSPTEGRDWEGQILPLHNNVICNDVCAENSVSLRWSLTSSHLVWNVFCGQTGLVPSVDSHVPATLSHTGFSWIISNLTHPDFGTSVHTPVLVLFFVINVLSPMNSRVCKELTIEILSPLHATQLEKIAYFGLGS